MQTMSLNSHKRCQQLCMRISMSLILTYSTKCQINKQWNKMILIFNLLNNIFQIIIWWISNKISAISNFKVTINNFRWIICNIINNRCLRKPRQICTHLTTKCIFKITIITIVIHSYLKTKILSLSNSTLLNSKTLTKLKDHNNVIISKYQILQVLYYSVM